MTHFKIFYESNAYDTNCRLIASRKSLRGHPVLKLSCLPGQIKIVCNRKRILLHDNISFRPPMLFVKGQEIGVGSCKISIKSRMFAIDSSSVNVDIM